MATQAINQKRRQKDGKENKQKDDDEEVSENNLQDVLAIDQASVSSPIAYKSPTMTIQHKREEEIMNTEDGIDEPYDEPEPKRVCLRQLNFSEF